MSKMKGEYVNVQMPPRPMCDKCRRTLGEHQLAVYCGDVPDYHRFCDPCAREHCNNFDDEDLTDEGMKCICEGCCHSIRTCVLEPILEHDTVLAICAHFHEVEFRKIAQITRDAFSASSGGSDPSKPCEDCGGLWDEEHALLRRCVVVEATEQQKREEERLEKMWLNKDARLAAELDEKERIELAIEASEAEASLWKDKQAQEQVDIARAEEMSKLENVRKAYQSELDWKFAEFESRMINSLETSKTLAVKDIKNSAFMKKLHDEIAIWKEELAISRMLLTNSQKQTAEIKAKVDELKAAAAAHADQLTACKVQLLTAQAKTVENEEKHIKALESIKYERRTERELVRRNNEQIADGESRIWQMQKEFSACQVAMKTAEQKMIEQQRQIEELQLREDEGRIAELQNGIDACNAAMKASEEKMIEHELQMEALMRTHEEKKNTELIEETDRKIADLQKEIADCKEVMKSSEQKMLDQQQQIEQIQRQQSEGSSDAMAAIGSIMNKMSDDLRKWKEEDLDHPHRTVDDLRFEGDNSVSNGSDNNRPESMPHSFEELRYPSMPASSVTAPNTPIAN